MNECSLCGLPATKWKWIPAGNDDGCIVCQDCNPSELRARIAALEAENERLRVCATCGHELDPEWLDGAPYCRAVGSMQVGYHDPCHFKPSRWKMRD